MKKLLSLLVCLSLLTALCAAAIPAGAMSSGSCGIGVTWELYASSGTLKISGEGDMQDFYFDYDRYGDLVLYTPWEDDKDGIWKVVISSGVKSIGSNAFYGFSDLTTVSIANTVTSIGSSAFENCTSLQSVTIPDSVKKIGSTAFKGCTSLNSIQIPDSVTSFGSGVFNGCSALALNEYSNANYIGNSSNPYVVLLKATNKNITSFTVNEGTKVIAAQAFYGCKSLTDVTIPLGVVGVGGLAFYDCDAITDVTLGCTSFHMASVFSSCRSTLKNITILDGVTTIPKDFLAESMYDGYEVLESVTIPASVTSIGENALFYKVIPSKIKIYITDIAAWCRTSIRGDSLKKYDLYLNGELLTDLVIPDEITSINNYAFYKCAGIENLTIPDTVTSIGYCAFNSCSGLKTVTIGDGTSSIAEQAFYSCPFLESVEVGTSLTSIGTQAFCKCVSLSQITLKSTPYVYSNAFNNCDSLSDVYLYGSRDDWMEIRVNAEDGNQKLKQAAIHYIETDPCAINGHVIVRYEVPPTCSSDGAYFDKCSVCKKVVDTGDIPALGHVWGEGTLTREPTYTVPGEVTYTCTVCGETHTEETELKPPLGGDTDGDGFISVRDLSTIKKAMTGDNGISIIAVNCDVDGDGVLTVKDVAALKRMIAG